MTEKRIVPVLLGADLNCYSVARAFHEAYGVRSYAFGRYMLGITRYSRIIDFTVVENLDTTEVLLPTLAAFAEAHRGDALYLIGCTDAYADLITENRDVLSKNYFCPGPDAALAEKLVSKEGFYAMCEHYGIDYPHTVVLANSADMAKLRALPFSYPVIVKPSSSIRYWQHPFAGMKKVYKAASPDEAEEIAAAIFGSGYDDSLIVQDFIPGDDSGMYVATAYSARDTKVKMMCMGHVLLEEHTPKGVGNHAAIVTEYHADILEKLKNFLETTGYRGFANFDIKFDPRDGKFKVFEINLRQGRSNHYVTHSGANLAELLVGDREGTLADGCNFITEPAFWHTVPKKIIYSYIENNPIKETVKKLVKSGNCGDPLRYRYDLCMNPMRIAYVIVHRMRYFKKYKRYP